MRNIPIVIALLAASPLYAVDFAIDIEPILHQRCLDCHGPDEQNSQFRVDRLASMLSGGNSGEPAVVPGKPEASFLVRLIKHEESGKEMPPDDSLAPNEIELIEKWIAEGATTPEHYGGATVEVDLSHWSFQPIQRPASADGMDGFIRERLAENGLKPSPEAERSVLIRRLYLVMLGLPPTPEQVQAFVQDDRADAWQHLVDRVLNSPHYGERWASHWLDLVRFGETNGFETNRERPNAWHYRDWVIRSLGEDKPYDEFIREQIAGDALGADVATGFLVAGPYDLVKGQDPKLGQIQRMNELDDMINTTGTAFLGLTTGCARCHNHKFDPISQRDYYSMQAVFAGVQHGDRLLPASEETKQRIEQLDVESAELANQLKKFIPKISPASIVIDESAAEHREQPQGRAAKQGHDDADFGGKQYTWWTNRPGQEIVVYRPRIGGAYRIWLSWGAGYQTHCADARYVIKSKSGDVEIARVNQQLRADRTGDVDQVARWSGFHDAGVHELGPDDVLVLVGGSNGSAVTGDVVVFQPMHRESRRTGDDRAEPVRFPPVPRPAVRAKRNEEIFPPRKARFVRFTIETTSNSEACIDELEIYSADRNVALASGGAKATSSGDFVHPKHKLPHINDGLHGNDRSWIVDSRDGGWVQIELAEPAVIDRIVWGRDREGVYSDRLAIGYRIEASADLENWELLASSGDRQPYGNGTSADTIYQFAGFSKAEADQGRRWRERLKAAQSEQAELEKSTLVYAGNFSQPGPTHRLYRGEPDAKREQVKPDGIRVFTSLPLGADSPEQQRRLALADWIASDDNPLTARVIVNRLWQFHFGTGIVDTPSDFGTNGTRPTHPKLLDFLASELIDSGWSLKHIHRTILGSATWRQSNQPRAGAMKVDASSRLLWRFPPRRLEAEAIRDSILAVSGVLDFENAGGPGFSAFAVEMENVRHYHAKEKYGPEDWRRMIYMTKVRQEKDQVFGAFDCPDASMVVPKRSRSTTPLQALNLLNSHFIVQQAELFARRLELERDTVPERVTRAWELCFQRTPTSDELADSEKFIQQQGIVQFARAMLNANEFVFIP